MKTLKHLGMAFSLGMFALTAQAQKPNASLLVQEGTHWVERLSDEGTYITNDDFDPVKETFVLKPEKANPLYELVKYKIEGEEKIDGITYKKVFYNDGSKVYGYLREDTDGKVYYLAGKEILAYDFDWQKGKELRANPYANNTKEYVMAVLPEEEIPTLAMEDGSELEYFTDPTFRTESGHFGTPLLIRGIGLTAGPLVHVEGGMNCICFKELLCFYQGERLVYLNPLFKEDGSFDFEYIEGVEKHTSSFQVFTGKGQVLFSETSGNDCPGMQLSIYQTSGELVCQQSMRGGSALVSGLSDGIYMYRLDDGKGNVARGKFIFDNSARH